MDIRKRVLFYKDDVESWFDYVRHPIQVVLCFFKGHEPIPDQCRKPEHDFCAWCLKRLPNSVKR